MKFNPADFYWCKYDSDRATNIQYKNKTFRIVKGMVLGVCELRGQVDEVVMLDETSFRMPRSECDKLMTKVKAYRGKIVFDSEKTAKPAVVATPKTDKSKRIQPIVVKQESQARTTAKEVAALLRKAKISMDDLKTGGPKARAKRVQSLGPYLVDDAQGVRVLKYLKSHFSYDSRFVAELDTVSFKQTSIKVQQVEKPAKPTRTIIAPTHKLKLQDVEFPEASDMADTDIPQEFLDRANSSAQKSKRGETKVFVHLDEAAFVKV